MNSNKDARMKVSKQINSNRDIAVSSKGELRLGRKNLPSKVSYQIKLNKEACLQIQVNKYCYMSL